jgi:hypothetical protein
MKATAILFGRGQRHYRDDDDAVGLVELMRHEVAAEWTRTFGASLPRKTTSAAEEEEEEKLAGRIGERMGAAAAGAAEEDGRGKEAQAGGREAGGRKVVGSVREGNLPVLETRSGEGGKGRGGRL